MSDSDSKAFGATAHSISLSFHLGTSMLSGKGKTMQFILTGFTADKAFRVFAFERILTDRTRTPFTVRTDLSLIHKYGIRVQELPLLCRELLEQSEEGESAHAFTFGEEEMRLHAALALADREEAQKKRLTRKAPFVKTAAAGALII